MKNLINKIFFLILIFAILVGINKTTVKANSGSVSLSGGGNVTEGSTVSINISVNADVTLTGIEIGIGYDSSILEYVSGAGVGGGGTVKIAEGVNGSSLSYTITFKAIGVGTATVRILENGAIGATDVEFQLSGGTRSTSVTVNAPKTASANNSLASLQISPGTLSPAFSSKTLNYSTTVENSVTKLAVTAVPQDGGAQVTGVSGSGDLKVGSNTVRISVTAENGSVATYTINVTRQAGTGAIEEEQEQPEQAEETEETVDEEEEQEETNIEITVGGQKLYMYNDFKEEKIPDGFEKSTITYQNQEINVVKNSTGNLILVYLVDENDENGAFYVYDEATGTFSEFIEVAGATNRYFVVNPDDTVIIPAGYVETTIELDGKTVKAWYLETDGIGGFYLVYVVNWEGQKGFYQYDSLEGTFQRFVDTGGSVPASTVIEDEDNNADIIENLESRLNELQKKYDKDMSTRLKIISLLAILVLVGVICIINLLFKIKGIKDDRQEIQEEYLDDDLADDYLNEEEEAFSIDQTKESDSLTQEKDSPFLEKEKETSQVEEEDDDFDFIDLDDEDKS